MSELSEKEKLKFTPSGDNHETGTSGIRGNFVIGGDGVQQSAGTRRKYCANSIHRDACSNQHGCTDHNDTAHRHTASNRYSNTHAHAASTHHRLDA